MISATELLHSAGLKITRQRELVLVLLTDRRRPVTAQDLHREIQDTGIGLTTVYRALKVLTSVGLLHVFETDGELAYRMCRPGRHHHLVCRICSAVTEGPPSADLESGLTHISNEHGFALEAHRIEIYGVCRTCQTGT
jgi:Fur family ferric uptake transcriptional regulator